MKAIILGAERGIRRLSPADSYPRTLIEDATGRRVMDWILASLKDNGIDDIIYVGGYHIEKLIGTYPQLRYFYNPQWDKTGSVHSLFLAQSELSGDCLVIEGNIVFHSEVVRRFLDSDDDILVGLKPAENGQDTSSLASDFSGLFRLNDSGADTLKQSYLKADHEKLKSADIPELLRLAGNDGAKVETVLIDSGWSQIQSATNLSRFIMGSKAQTLERLRTVVRTAEILEQVRFRVTRWREDPEQVIDEIQTMFPNERLIVRSSAAAEDEFHASHAGAFESILDISSSDRDGVRASVEKVIASFDLSNKNSDEDEIFVQAFLQNIKVSGVVLTRDLETAAPYVIVNYDNSTGSSNTVTGGHGREISTAYAIQTHKDLLPNDVRPMVPVIDELVGVIGHDNLDIEFAINDEGKRFVLQVRPITPEGRATELDERDIIREVDSAKKFVETTIGGHSLLLGSTTYYADMTDWNPAEMIGTRPRPLANSLYRTLITDSTWARSRAQLGYRDLMDTPLMVAIAGKPYIDVQASLNSFLPAALDDHAGAELVDIMIGQLRSEPYLQDKVEFEIAPTCLDFDFERLAGKFLSRGAGKESIAKLEAALRPLTANIITGKCTSQDEQLALIDELTRRRRKLLQSDPQTPLEICRTVDILIKDCARLGTLPFANVARHAFIAMRFLKSLVARDVITADGLAEALTALPTVAHRITQGIQDVIAGNLPLPGFLEQYGHLRPGTYDVLQPNYSEAPHHYLALSQDAKPLDNANPAPLGLPAVEDDSGFIEILTGKSKDIDSLLRQTGFDFSADTLIRFMARSIPLRENAKFEFTKNVSAALSLIRRFADVMDMPIDDISFLPIGMLTNYNAEAPHSTWKQALRHQSRGNRKLFSVTSILHLPSTIAQPQDVFAFVETKAKPNFITDKSVTAPYCILPESHDDYDLTGKIIAIEGADPGYDWLLARNIKGLVTKYGGVASHMSIRCAEFNLPAAIGCGEDIFERLRHARVVELSCGAGRIQAVE